MHLQNFNIELKLFLQKQFEGVEIALDSRVGVFITMNPGSAGRTELPDPVKALFRPVVVIVPDLQQICEIMLFSEGFSMAKVKKFNNVKICLPVCFKNILFEKIKGLS